jgi:hypothetical protein
MDSARYPNTTATARRASLERPPGSHIPPLTPAARVRRSVTAEGEGNAPPGLSAAICVGGLAENTPGAVGHYSLRSSQSSSGRSASQAAIRRSIDPGIVRGGWLASAPAISQVDGARDGRGDLDQPLREGTLPRVVRMRPVADARPAERHRSRSIPDGGEVGAHARGAFKILLGKFRIRNRSADCTVSAIRLRRHHSFVSAEDSYWNQSLFRHDASYKACDGRRDACNLRIFLTKSRPPMRRILASASSTTIFSFISFRCVHYRVPSSTRCDIACASPPSHSTGIASWGVYSCNQKLSHSVG